jgi:hypothetical protein
VQRRQEFPFTMFRHRRCGKLESRTALSNCSCALRESRFSSNDHSPWWPPRQELATRPMISLRQHATPLHRRGHESAKRNVQL